MTGDLQAAIDKAMEPEKVAFQARIYRALEEAGVPMAHLSHDKNGMLFCDRSGYLASDGGKRYTFIAVLGNTTVSETIRGAERDSITQQARAALDAIADLTVRISEYGHLTVVKRCTS